MYVLDNTVLLEISQKAKNLNILKPRNSAKEGIFNVTSRLVISKLFPRSFQVSRNYRLGSVN